MIFRERWFRCIFKATLWFIFSDSSIAVVRALSCTICGKVFPSPSHVARHMKIHTGQKDFQCKICGKYFRLKHHLKSHIMLHMQNKMWERENSLTINNYFLWDGCVCILTSDNISVRRLWIRVNSNRCLDSNDSKNITLWTNWGYSCINRCSIPQAVCWWKLVSQTTHSFHISQWSYT